MNNHPNIFSYATKELSQDAFFSWLINWDSPEYKKNKLHECAVKFINILLPEDKQIDIVSSVKTWQQWKHIDIWITVNEKIAIVIEDKINTSEHNNQLGTYESVARSWCEQHDCECYFVFLKTGFIKQVKENYLRENHKDWKIVGRKEILKIVNIFKETVDNNIFIDYVENLNRIEDSSKAFLSKNIDDWDYAAKEGFYNELDCKISELTGWGYVNNPSGGFLGFWWHWVTCKNNSFSYYLQIQDMELFIRIEAKDLNKDEQVNIRNEAIELLESKLNEEEKDKIEKPKRLSCGNYMAIKHVVKKAWLEEKDGFIVIERTIEKLNEISCILDRCKE